MGTSDREIWDQVLAHLRKSHPQVCRRWFVDLEHLGMASGAFGVRAHSTIHRDYLRRDCLDAFNDAIGNATEQLIAVRFLGPDDKWKADRKATKKASAAPAQASERRSITRSDELPIDPDHEFETFVVGPNNRMAQAAAVGVCTKPGGDYNPLFIHGGVGLGKTHLLQAICQSLHQTDPTLVLHYVSCEAFITQFIHAVQSGEMPDFHRTFREVDILVVDDIQFLSGHEGIQEEFFHTFNSLRQAKKQIVLSSDRPPDEIPDLAERLVSRFQWGVVTEIQPPGFETRAAIVRAKALSRGVAIPENVAEHIARAVNTNIRHLEEAIGRLQLHATVDDCKIDLEMAREVIPVRETRPTGGPTIDAIIGSVSEFFHVKRTDILGKGRQKSISLPRQVCMYIARRQTRHSLEEVGAHFGNRDHTTVMHAVRKVEGMVEQNAEFASVVETLEGRVRGSETALI